MGVQWVLALFVLGVVNCSLDHVRVSENVYDDLPDLQVICANYEGVDGVSDACANQLEVVCENLTLRLTMFDASSKFPYAGLGFASEMDYGNFDQCMTVDHHSEGGRILGKHCTVGLLIPDISEDMSDPTTYYRLSSCRPDACYASDLNAIAQSIISEFPDLFQDLMCQTSESYSTFTAGDIVTLTIFAVFVALMTASTVYDVYLYQNQLKHSHPLLTSFSVLSNGRKLMHISTHSHSKEHIEPFNGLRVISMIWIVAGHGLVGWQSISVTDRRRVADWLNHLSALYISTAHLAVDTFFYMSGFLLAFQYLKVKGKPLIKQLMAVPSMYLHRYLRLTPAMLMIYLLVITIFKHIGDGPLWPSNETLAQTCRDNAMSFFLYIQNYYNYDNLCITQTWYLSADMQMFLLSPLILIPLSLVLSRASGYKKAMIGMLLLNIFFTFMPMAIRFIFPEYNENEYDTHSRLINYCIGIMLGVFMREKIDKPFLYAFREKSRYTINLVVWVIILLGLVATIINYQAEEMNDNTARLNVFYSLMRPAWCIGLSWITYSCYHGHGGFVNWILTRPIYQVLGRLTYCIYLVHGSVIIFYILTVRSPWHFTDYNAFYVFCGHYIMSIIVAIVWTLAFESPLIIVEKFLTGGGRTSGHAKSVGPPNGGVQPDIRKSGPHNGTNNDLPPRDVEFGGMYKKNNDIY